MKFSVIIPTYNRAGYIIEAVDSVLEQTYKNFEVIVVDDGSTDNTGEVVKQRYKDRQQVKYYRKQNEERGAARNYGLNHASGDYAVFFDSDDWMKPEYLQVLHDAIRSQKEPELVAAKYIFRDENGKEYGSALQNVREGWYGIETFLKGNMLACNYCVKTGTALHKLFPPERELAAMEDWLFLLLHLTDKKIYIVNRTGVVMREHSGRSMADNRKVIEARKKATAWALKHIQLTPGRQKTLQAFSAYFCGVHEYLDGRRLPAIKQSLQAIRSGGAKPRFIVLLLKSIVGKKFINRLK